jgi:Na+-transporting NADH:ubiquinone oxidoreductase subunit A
MSEMIKIKRGVDIKLLGQAEQLYGSTDTPKTYAIKPDDFPGIRLKLKAREGDELKVGDTVFYDRDRDDIKIPSPVSGEVVEVKRGAKRKILEVRILADSELKYHDYGAADPTQLDRQEVRKKLTDSGAWAFIRQRPYHIIPNPQEVPRDIFVSCFDTAPLAPDTDFVVHGLEEEFKLGIQALQKLTDGDVHLGVDGHTNPSKAFTGIEGTKVHRFKGPHPAGNVGVQIHHIKPINKGEKVFTVNFQDVLIIGRLFRDGKLDAQRFLALAGSEVEKPRYYKLLLGAQLTNLLTQNVKEGKNRYISGNVLTGTKISQEGYLGFYDHQVTVIPEGGEDEFFGWIKPDPNKFSMSRTLLSWLMPGKRYRLNANMNGEERAYVMTGQYESVFPFDIYPVQLIKSMLINDLETMEKLGAYEVADEDFALCEVVCTSKIPVQQTVREGLDLMLKEIGD